MAKKRFTDDFDSLFGDPWEDSSDQPKDSQQAKPAQAEQVEQAEDAKKKSSGKQFTDSLQSFLAETFEASFERQMAEAEKGKSQPKKKSSRPRRRRSSLDMLIRSTVEPSKVEIEDRPKRRITLTFEPQKLEKLRNIAKVERAMLKDIINEIVGDYIRKYENEKGNTQRK